MIVNYCLVLDNYEPFSSTHGLSSLDWYKSAIEVFIRKRLKVTGDIGDNFFYSLYCTATGLVLPFSTDLAQVLHTLKEIVVPVRHGGVTDWKETFENLSVYLAASRTASQQDTIGQGTFMSLVQKTFVLVFCEEFVEICNSGNLQGEFGDAGWERGDLLLEIFHRKPQITFCSEFNQKRSALILQDSMARLKAWLGVKSELVVSEVGYESLSFLCGWMEAFALSYGAHHNLIVSVSLSQSKPRMNGIVELKKMQSGFWPFPESAQYLEALQVSCEKYRKIIPRDPSIIQLRIETVEKQDFEIPKEFPHDLYLLKILTTNSSNVVDDYHHQQSMVSTGKFFNVYLESDQDSTKSFGFASLVSTNMNQLELELWIFPPDFRHLFEILLLYSTESVDEIQIFGKLLEYMNEKLPSYYWNPLKSSLRVFFGNKKFDSFLRENGGAFYHHHNHITRNDEEALKKCLEIRNEMAENAHNFLKETNFLKTNSDTMQVEQIDDLSNHFFSLCRKLASFGNGEEEQEKKYSVSVAKMGDYLPKLQKQITKLCRNPYLTTEEEIQQKNNIFKSIFSNPYALTKSISTLPSKQKLKLLENAKKSDFPLDVDALSASASSSDEFCEFMSDGEIVSDASCTENEGDDDSPIVSSSGVDMIEQLSISDEIILPQSTLNELIQIIKTPGIGGSISKFIQIIDPNNLQRKIDKNSWETLKNECSRFKKNQILQCLYKYAAHPINI